MSPQQQRDFRAVFREELLHDKCTGPMFIGSNHQLVERPAPW